MSNSLCAQGCALTNRAMLLKKTGKVSSPTSTMSNSLCAQGCALTNRAMLLKKTGKVSSPTSTMSNSMRSGLCLNSDHTAMALKQGAHSISERLRNTTGLVEKLRSILVGHAVGHMAGGHVGTRGFAVLLLVVEEDIGTVGLEEDRKSV